MNPMPSMVRHQSAGAPTFAGRGHARGEQGADSFDLVLAEAGRGDRTADGRTDRLSGAAEDPSDTSDVDRDEAACEAKAEAGILPLLRIVVPSEKEGAGPAAEGLLVDAALTQEAETRPTMKVEPQAEIPAEPAEDTGPRSAAPTVSAETRQELEDGPTNARLDAKGAHAAGTADTQNEVPPGAVGDENLRRIEAAVGATPQAGGAAVPAASASLSLLARLNQMNTPTGRTASAQQGVNADRPGSEEVPLASDTAQVEKAEVEAARAFRPGEDTSDDRPADARNPADVAGRAGERNAPLITAAPSAGQPANASTQVVQALASNTNGVAHARAVAASANRDASAGGTVQSLKIQLKPHDLGQVTANLTISGDKLSIEIEVDTIEAHRRLSSESDAIAKALRAHGIVVDQVTVQQPAQSPGPASDGNARDSSALAGRDARDSGSSGNSAGRNQGSPSMDRDHGQETRSTAESHVPGARSGSGVYI